MPHVDDLILYLRIVYSRRFIDRFESQITAEIKQLRLSNASRLDRRMWSEEARRSLRYALFLRYYASFESHLKVVCERFAHSRSLPLRLSDVNGDNFLNKTNKYLTRVARCEPLDKHPLWNDLVAYSWIRNAIIHNDGRLLDPNSIPQHVARQLKQPSAALALSPEGQIKMKRRFCYRAVKQMAQFLLDVYDRRVE
jgi:hypothetical protein